MPNIRDPREPTHDWPDAVIFDFDGTLADTAARWESAFRRCLEHKGKRLTPAQNDALAGASVAGAAQMLGVPPAELSCELETTFRAAPIRPMPGASSLLKALHPRVRLAIASNGPEALVRLGLRQAGLDHFFETVISAEQTTAFKPAPDVYLRAAAEIGCDPLRSVGVEDSAAGARAARQAGLYLIYVSARPAPDVEADLIAARLDDRAVMCRLSSSAGPTPTTGQSNATR